jgi:molecular chaperone GrpE
MSDNKNKAEFNENGMEDIEELKTESVNNEAAEEVKDEPLKEIIKAKEEELNELNSRFMRLQADFINHKRRTENEKENSISDGIEFVMRDLLPIIDNFQRALESEVDKEDGFYKGISMIEQQLFDLLKNYSVMEIDCLGKAFDPNYHDAVFMEESDKYEPGMITEVLQKGYKLKEKVIRPAMVKVSK